MGFTNDGSIITQLSIVFVAFAFWVLSVPLLRYTQMGQPEGIDNSAPRAQYQRLVSILRLISALTRKGEDGMRAKGVVDNSLEALVLISAAVFAGIFMGNGNETAAASLAIIFIAARAFYPIPYLLNYSTLRTLVWTVALGCVIGIWINGFVGWAGGKRYGLGQYIAIGEEAVIPRGGGV